jgi:SAM-dependent methyltransferase
MPEPDLAETFGRQAALYERVRPGWPAEAVRFALGKLEIGREARVLDLAAGTGKLTRRLVAEVEHVVAVEPLAGMRALLRSQAPRATVLDGTAERIPLPDASVDAVLCADAFHWFDADAAIGEIARVLRPRGGLVLLWNGLRRPTEPPVTEAVELLNRRGHPDRRARNFLASTWSELFTSAGFSPISEASFDHAKQTDRADLLGYWRSMSWVAALPDREQADLIDSVAALLDADSYTVFWWTELFLTRRAAV